MTNLSKKGQKANKISLTVQIAVIFAFTLFFKMIFMV